MHFLSKLYITVTVITKQVPHTVISTKAELEVITRHGGLKFHRNYVHRKHTRKNKTIELSVYVFRRVCDVFIVEFGKLARFVCAGWWTKDDENPLFVRSRSSKMSPRRIDAVKNCDFCWNSQFNSNFPGYAGTVCPIQVHPGNLVVSPVYVHSADIHSKSCENAWKCWDQVLPVAGADPEHHYERRNLHFFQLTLFPLLMHPTI